MKYYFSIYQFPFGNVKSSEKIFMNPLRNTNPGDTVVIYNDGKRDVKTI